MSLILNIDEKSLSQKRKAVQKAIKRAKNDAITLYYDIFEGPSEDIDVLKCAVLKDRLDDLVALQKVMYDLDDAYNTTEVSLLKKAMRGGKGGKGGKPRGKSKKN